VANDRTITHELWIQYQQPHVVAIEFYEIVSIWRLISVQRQNAGQVDEQPTVTFGLKPNMTDKHSTQDAP
jgi:hypothetical protein